MTIPATANQSSKPSSPRLSSRNIRSQIAPAMAICGLLDIGAMLPRATTGCPAPGRGPLKWAICGRRDIGDLSAAGTAITTAFGAGISATTAALTTDSVTSESGIRAGTGTATVSTTTVR